MAEDSAIVNNVCPVGDRECLPHVMVGNQHSNSARPQPADDLLQVENGDRINAGKRFVQQDKCGIDAQAARNFNAPPLASGQSKTTVLANVFQTQLVDQRLHLFPTFVPGNWLRLEHRQNIFFDG